MLLSDRGNVAWQWLQGLLAQVNMTGDCGAPDDEHDSAGSVLKFARPNYVTTAAELNMCSRALVIGKATWEGPHGTDCLSAGGVVAHGSGPWETAARGAEPEA